MSDQQLAHERPSRDAVKRALADLGMGYSAVGVNLSQLALDLDRLEGDQLGAALLEVAVNLDRLSADNVRAVALARAVALNPPR
jgi:hypothetical protein